MSVVGWRVLEPREDGTFVVEVESASGPRWVEFLTARQLVELRAEVEAG